MKNWINCSQSKQSVSGQSVQYPRCVYEKQIKLEDVRPSAYGQEYKYYTPQQLNVYNTTDSEIKYCSQYNAYYQSSKGCCQNYNNKCWDQMDISGIQLQLEGEKILQIMPKQNIIFNKVITEVSPCVTYEGITGEVMIKRAGIYYAEWWVATDGIMGGEDTFVAFSIVTSQGQRIKGVNINATGQVIGSAILPMYIMQCTPVRVALMNDTDGKIIFGEVPIKANLSIMRIGNI